MRGPTVRPVPPRRAFPRDLAAALLLLAAALLLPAAASAGDYLTRNVALVIIDGLRYSEGLGDPTHANVPEMWALAQQGAIVEPFRNDGITYTSRAIPAIWCGAWTAVDEFSDPDCGGVTNSFARMPTVFEYYRRGLERPAEDCVYFLKDVWCPWRPSFDPDYGPDYWPLYHPVGDTDLEVWLEVEPLLSQHTPSFFVLYLADVDHAGHLGSWSGYLDAIATADGIVGMLWELLQSHPAYAGTTTMIVTNDHGRHDYDFTGHGDSCAGCRTIQLLAVGPDTPPGLVSTVPRAIPDIVPTIGELLGFATEDATGSAMLELLAPGAGPLFVDGFESGSAAAWSASAGVSGRAPLQLPAS